MRKGWRIFIVSFLLVVLLIIGLFYYFATNGPKYDYKYQNVENPIGNLSSEQAMERFDETFISYVLIELRAYNLHSVPVTGEKPRMEFYAGNDVYNAEISSGVINVLKGSAVSKDIIIRTTKEEAIKMVQNKSYIVDSFNIGRSSFEKVAGSATLFNKGYLNLYNELTGSGVTGSVIRTYRS